MSPLRRVVDEYQTAMRLCTRLLRYTRSLHHARRCLCRLVSLSHAERHWKDHGFAYPDGKFTIEIMSSSAHHSSGLCASLVGCCRRISLGGHREPLIRLGAFTGTYSSDFASPFGLTFFRQRETLGNFRPPLRPRCVHPGRCSQPTTQLPLRTDPERLRCCIARGSSVSIPATTSHEMVGQA